MGAKFNGVKLFGNGIERSRNVEERFTKVIIDPTCIVGMRD